MTSAVRKETFTQFTERAMEAVDAGKWIPPIVYLPAKLRANNLRVTIDNTRLTTDPPSIRENHIRIAEADPLGFLIAIMNGQPIPRFEIEDDNSITVKYHIPKPGERTSVAFWLAHKVTIRTNDQSREGRSSNPPEEWEQIVARRETETRENAPLKRRPGRPRSSPLSDRQPAPVAHGSPGNQAEPEDCQEADSETRQIDIEEYIVGSGQDEN